MKTLLIDHDHSTQTRRIIWCLAAILVFCGVIWAQRPAAAIERPGLNAALLATVRVAVPIADEQDTYSTGSGTVLTNDGYILTNFHVMGDVDKQELYNSDGIAMIAVNPTNLRGQPIWKYHATLVKGSPTLDLAVVKIDGLLDNEEAPLPDNLGLAPITIGDSEAVQIGDEIDIFGFPGIGQETVTYTKGSISGFVDENKDDVVDWFKTDAMVAHGNSGGLATDDKGQMIGIPTAGITDEDAATSISLIRPVDLALPLVRAAISGEGGSGSKTSAGVESQNSEAWIDSVQFAAAISRSGQAIDPALRFPTSTTTIYAVFEYGGFQDGQQFEFVWYRDSKEIYRDQFVWQDASEGTQWVNVSSKKALGAGLYGLEMTLDGTSLFYGVVSVADQAPAKSGSFGPITFAAGIDDNGQPVDAGDTFSNVTEIYAFFDAKGVPNGAIWTRRWAVDGEVAVEVDEVWGSGNNTGWWISVSASDGMPVGHYELELLIEGKSVQTGEFDVVDAGQSQAQPVLVVGTVTEEDNRRRPIEGANVFFLNPGTPTQVFLDDPKEELVAGFGVSDENGEFTLHQPLIPGEVYGVVVYHEKYRVVSVDDYQLPPEATSPWEISITMKRR